MEKTLTLLNLGVLRCGDHKQRRHDTGEGRLLLDALILQQVAQSLKFNVHSPSARSLSEGTGRETDRCSVQHGQSQS